MKVHSLTPVLIVESIAECLPFWVDRLGFTVTAEVPHGDHPGFVILHHGEIELMLQSVASVRDDVPALAADRYRCALFLRVDDLAAIQRALGAWPRIVDARETFYGTRETVVRDPAGNPVTFAERIATAS